MATNIISSHLKYLILSGDNGLEVSNSFLWCSSSSVKPIFSSVFFLIYPSKISNHQRIKCLLLYDSMVNLLDSRALKIRLQLHLYDKFVSISRISNYAIFFRMHCLVIGILAIISLFFWWHQYLPAIHSWQHHTIVLLLLKHNFCTYAQHDYWFIS